ncbi:MAG: histidyl-tRNA synthetase [Planctomycetota bacterium]
MSNSKSKERKVYRAPRGVRDVLPEEVPLWELLERTAADLARRRGFREIRPALLEDTALFTRSLGEVTDIVEKEMFTIHRGEGDSADSVTLRPEGTAGIVRAYVQGGYAKTQPLQKLFHTGPMFRYERPQKGRERMFTQFDVEALGSKDPRLDAEVIHLAASFFEALGIDGLEVRMNSMGDGADRDAFREAVREYIRPLLPKYSKDSQSRFDRNVLRILDSKHPDDVALNGDAPKILEYLSDENRIHFERVQELLRRLGRTVIVDPSIVRGFDYYTRTVFEVHYPKLARSALCGGGRYDHLIEELGGPDLGAVGFAVGFTGTMIALEELGLTKHIPMIPAPVYVVGASDALEDEVFLLAEELRAGGIATVHDLTGKSVKKQMIAANKGGHRFVVVLGTKEFEGGCVQLKDMQVGEQDEVQRTNLLQELNGRIDAPAGN